MMREVLLPALVASSACLISTLPHGFSALSRTSLLWGPLSVTWATDTVVDRGPSPEEGGKKMETAGRPVTRG